MKRLDSIEPNRESGLTLLELAVSLVVLMSGLIAVAGTLTTAGKRRAEAETEYRLHQIASTQLEQFKTSASSIQEFVNRFSGAQATFDLDPEFLQGLPISNASGSYTVDPTDLGIARSARLTVSISYTDGLGDDRVHSVSTMVNKENP